MKSPNASASAFGWDFQSNASIFLMLKNIKEATSVKVEGQTEDIEISLDNGNMIYSQVKSVVDPSDYTHVKDKLMGALRTFDNASTVHNVEKLVYITNSPNPFGNSKTMSYFTGVTCLSFAELPQECQNAVNEILNKQSYRNIDTGKLEIRVIPFYGDDADNRYKAIKETVTDFFSDIEIDGTFLKKMMSIWQATFHLNETIKSCAISKKRNDMAVDCFNLRNKLE